MRKKIAILSLIFLILDQIIKLIVENTLNNSITIVKNFFYLTKAHNTGGAWSILADNLVLLIVIALVSLVLIYLFSIRNKKLNKLEIISYSLLIGGIMGNLIDRIVRGYVVDYLDFIIFGYNFPIFNLADSCIVISIILLFYTILKEDAYERASSK